MFEKELMIAGLRHQQNILGDLITQLEEKETLGREDTSEVHQSTGRIAKNLRKLRKIKDDYFLYLESFACPQ
ncbi:MAG: hypothetical protein NC930_03695 [Candidatus Omnitrophica bacterium]|nr:hypothetical protein [Candidatus Omnitrophota bacterium]